LGRGPGLVWATKGWTQKKFSSAAPKTVFPEQFFSFIPNLLYSPYPTIHPHTPPLPPFPYLPRPYLTLLHPTDLPDLSSYPHPPLSFHPPLPSPTLPYPPLPYLPTLPSPTLPYSGYFALLSPTRPPLLPCPTLPYPTLPYPTLPYPTLPYPSIPSPTLHTPIPTSIPPPPPPPPFPSLPLAYLTTPPYPR